MVLELRGYFRDDLVHAALIMSPAERRSRGAAALV
jgi:hypothetical protein